MPSDKGRGSCSGRRRGRDIGRGKSWVSGSLGVEVR